jgi:hypothetical protein
MDEQPSVPTPPDSDFGRMDVVGIELHEMYLTLQRVGFDKKEALYIISIAVSEGAMSPRIYFSPEDTRPYNIDDDEDFPDDGDFDPLF